MLPVFLPNSITKSFTFINFWDRLKFCVELTLQDVQLALDVDETVVGSCLYIHELKVLVAISASARTIGSTTNFIYLSMYLVPTLINS